MGSSSSSANGRFSSDRTSLMARVLSLDSNFLVFCFFVQPSFTKWSVSCQVRLGYSWLDKIPSCDPNPSFPNMGLGMIRQDIPCFILPNHVPEVYPRFNIILQACLICGNLAESVDNYSSSITFSVMARFVFEKLRDGLTSMRVREQPDEDGGSNFLVLSLRAGTLLTTFNLNSFHGTSIDSSNWNFIH